MAIGELRFVLGAKLPEPGQFVRRGDHAELSGQEVVAGVAVLDLDDVPGDPQSCYLTGQQHLHLYPSLTGQW